jgi:hypothetical protein
MANDFNPMLPTTGDVGRVQFSQPVTDTATGSGLSDIAQSLNNAVDLFSNAQKLQAKKQSLTGISSYAEEVGKLQAGYEQGRLTRTQVDAQRRAVFRDYSTRYPDNITEFSAVEKQMFGYSSNAKEEAIVAAGLAADQKALQAGWELLGTDATEDQARMAGTRRLQQEANINYAAKQLQLAQQTEALQGTVDKRMSEKAASDFTAVVNGSIADQTGVLMRQVLDKDPKELEQNQSELMQNVSRIRALVSMQLGAVQSEMGRQGINLPPEAVKAIRDNMDLQLSNIEAYIQSPTEQRKKAFQNLETMFKGNLIQISPEFAKLNALGEVTGGAMLGYMAEQSRKDLLGTLSRDVDRALRMSADALGGKLNLSALAPEEKNAVVGSLGAVLQSNVPASPAPDKDSDTFMKALKAFTSELPRASLSEQIGIIENITTPQFMANLDTAMKSGAKVNLQGIPEAVQQARTVLQVEISRMLNSQDPNAYAQNALGLNMQTDTEGNLTLNMEPPEVVASRFPSPDTGVPNFLNGRMPAEPGVVDTAGIGPSPMVAQIQKTVDTFNRLNGVLKLLGATPTGPQGTAGPPGPKSGITGSKGGDSVVMDAVRQVESGGNNKAVSPKGAVGAYQVMPATAKDPGYGIKPLEDPTDPKEARRFATEFLTAMKQEFGDNPYLAVLAYNAGPGPVKKWLAGKGDLPQETIDYGRKIMRELGGM